MIKKIKKRIKWHFIRTTAALFIMAPFLLGMGPGRAAAAGLAARVQAAYSGIKDISGNFTQESFLKDLGKKQEYQGRFVIKLPSEMRYIYHGSSEDQVIIKGGRIIIYQKKEKQALVGRFNAQTYGTAPVALLGGLGKIDTDFKVSEKKGDLILTPRSPENKITYIKVQPSKGRFPIKSFTIHDMYLNTVKITLKDVSVNTGVKDQAFEFTPPPGVSVFDYTRQDAN